MPTVLNRAFAALLITFVSGTMLSGCSMLGEGKERPVAQSEQKAAPAKAAAVYVYVPDTGALPLPLISPRREKITVAAGPSAPAAKAIAAATTPASAPPANFTPANLGMLAAPYVKYDKALGAAEASKLSTPTEVRKVLKDFRFTQAKAMAEAWYATRANIALQNGKFVEGIRDKVKEDGKDNVLTSLDSDSYVMKLPGAQEAAAQIALAESQQNGRLQKLSKRFLDVATQFQKTKKWGMIEPLTPDMTPVNYASSTTMDKLAETARAFSPISPAHASSAATMSRILALAARRAADAPVATIAVQDETTNCLNWARLNFNQCIAAAHFPSEEAWCIGTHAIKDVGVCWAKILPVSAH